MFKQLFNIGITPKEEPVEVKTERKPRKPRSIKVDAEKVISDLLEKLENVNNPKVDSLRTLYMSLSGDMNMDKLVAHYKQPIPVKTKKKKEKKNDKQISCGTVKWSV